MTYDKDLCGAIGKAMLNCYSLIDADGNYKLFGSTIRTQSGYSLAELENSNFRSYVHPEDLPEVLEQLSNIPAGIPTTLRPYRFRLKNQEYRWIETSVINLLSDPHVQGYLLNSKDNSEAIEAVKNRQKTTASYATFFAKHPFGVVHLTPDGRVDMINPQLSKDLGYDLQAIGGQPLVTFFVPQCRRKVRQMFLKALQLGEAESFDVEVYTAAGKVMQVNLTIVPAVYKGETIEIYAVIKDITDRYLLQESLKRTSMVADKATNGVVILNPAGDIEWVNNGFTGMNGYTLPEAIGRQPSDLLQSNSTPAIKQLMMQQLNAGHAYTKEVLCKRKDGSAFWNLVEITPVMDKNHQLEHSICIHTDITERKNAEQELKRFADDLYKRNKELQQFGYIVSHNLRSPVANIMGIANILEMDMHNPQTVEMCTQSLQSAVHSLDTVIRDLSKILSSADSSVELKKENIDLTVLLHQVKTDLKEVIRNAEAEVTVPVMPQMIHSHKAYLYSIFYNLISNAIKYRSERKPEICITVQPELDELNIQVTDNGIGIDMNRHKEEIFKPYRRFHRGIEGKGLGLFLVKSHVEALNGAIKIESEPDKGTQFTLLLPVNVPTGASTAEHV